MTPRRTLTWSVSLLGAVFSLSLLLYFLVPGALTRTILLFPGEISKSLAPEARFLPFTWDREHNAELLVREVLLGPSRHDHLRLFSRLGKVRTVLVREGIVYVDLSKEAFIPDPDVLYSPVTALEVLRTTLIDNIPGIAKVSFSVGGEPVRGIVVDKG